MSNLSSMHEAAQFIEQHLKAPMSVRDVADAAGYSVYHFSRTFNRVIGHSPYDYIMRRRLSESARELVELGKRIIDVAFEYQFNNPETYSRAFRRMFGVLPNQVSKSKELPRGIRPEATLAYIRHTNRGTYLRPALVEREAIHLVGLSSRAGDGADVLAELWELLGGEIERIPKRRKSPGVFGVWSSALSADPRASFLMLGVAADSLEAIPPTLVGKTIPPLSYARFIHKGPSRDLRLTLDYIHGTWLPKSGHSAAAPFSIEVYGEGYSGPNNPDSESEILIPIRKVEGGSPITSHSHKSQRHQE